ncbi:MAG: aspartate aminotransferase family protein [Zoogloeaceae bacterium]|jgi:adenosylmethionine-8-amino-7-oxononanoate aminotransferase|nr:aspartate aminotransferase family protein [Zoogloeaceae bacterium]
MKNSQKVFTGSVDKEYPTVDRAEGVYVWDTNGKKYLDCAAGVAVVNIGHGVREVRDAIYEQSKRVSYVYGSTFTSEARERLAEQIISLAPRNMEKVFFCSGGSEALESVIKIARQYHLESGKPKKFKVISRWQSYHGNTVATLSIGGRPSWREKYDPYMSDMPHIAQCNCYRCPYRLSRESCEYVCADELERVIKYEGADTVSAFVLEPITGTTAPAIVPPAGYMAKLREICDRHDVLLCMDEVITGLGRTGKNFAVDHFGVEPDLIAAAKGLGGGYVPIGAVLASSKVVDAFRKGSGNLMHSFTYAGNPVVCAGGSAVIQYLTDNRLVEASAVKGEFFLKLLREELDDHPNVGEIRGKGLLLGLEYVLDRKTKTPFPADRQISSRIAGYCFEKGLLVVFAVPGCADGILGDATQISPPFTIEEADMRKAVEILGDAVRTICI